MSIEAKTYLIRGAAALGAIAGAGYAVSEANANNQPEPYIQGIHSELELQDNSQFEVVCIDPENDQRPRNVDILQVRKAETETDFVYEFTLNGSVRSKISQLKPDIGIGIGFADADGLVSTIAGARGAEKTEDTRVQVETLSKPVILEQGPASPLKVESVKFEGGSELITVSQNGEVVTFRIPKVAIAGVPENEIYHTTEGVGHGNKTTQVHNKDICQPKAVTPPQAKPPKQELPPAIIQPPKQDIPKELPKSGMGENAQSSHKTDGALAALGIATLAGAACILKTFRQIK